MNLTKINKKKIFVTGYSGSGKTTFAKEYGSAFNMSYISFDENWKYNNPPQEEYKKMINLYPDEFITDAIPYSYVGDYLLFQDYYNEHQNDIKIVCVYCDNIDILHSRRPNKIRKELYEEVFNFYYSYLNFIRTWTDVEIEFYNSNTNQYSTYDELRVKMRNALRDGFGSYLNTLEYDKNYGAIECINFPGYTNSVHTWNNIKDLVDWKGKKVADLGCFHGYFSFRAAQAGATVTGLDKNTAVLTTTNIINFIENNPIELRIWEGGEEVPEEYDITLALNVIHHFDNIELSLQNIKSKTIIFEINQELVEPISKVFKIVKRVKSHRHDIKGVERLILLCERK